MTRRSWSSSPERPTRNRLSGYADGETRERVDGHCSVLDMLSHVHAIVMHAAVPQCLLARVRRGECREGLELEAQVRRAGSRKGKGRMWIGRAERASLLGALRCVAVVWFCCCAVDFCWILSFSHLCVIFVCFSSCCALVFYSFSSLIVFVCVRRVNDSEGDARFHATKRSIEGKRHVFHSI